MKIKKQFVQNKIYKSLILSLVLRQIHHHMYYKIKNKRILIESKNRRNKSREIYIIELGENNLGMIKIIYMAFLQKKNILILIEDLNKISNK